DRNHLAGHGQGGQSKYQSFQSSHEKSRFRIDQRTVKQQPLSHVGEKEKEQLSELLTNNTNIGHTEALRRGQYVGYHIVTCKLVGLEMQLRLRLLCRGILEVTDQRGAIGYRNIVPQNGAVKVDVQIDHDRFGRLFRIIRWLRHIQLDRMRLDWNGDDQHDDENEHHVDQRRGVHFHHYAGIVVTATYRHTHETSPTGAQRRRSAAHWFGDKANFTDTGPLTSLDNTPDTFVPSCHITANVHFRLRNLHSDGLQLFKQRIDIRYLKLVPVHRAVFGDGDHDVFRLGLCRYVARLGQLH